MGGRDAFLAGARVARGKDGDEGLRINGSGLETFGWIAVTQKAGVEGAVLHTFDNLGGERLVKVKLNAGVGSTIFAEDGG